MNKKMIPAILGLWVGLSGVYGSSSWAAEDAQRFRDVSPAHWGYAAIEWASGQGMIYGDPDGRFRPDDKVGQEEFLAMLLRAYRPDGFKEGDPGSPALWFTAYTGYWNRLGWRLIDSPDVNSPVTLSRGQAARIAANAAGKELGIRDAVQFLLQHGLAEGRTANDFGGFGAGESLTRAEAVTFIQRLKRFLPRVERNTEEALVYADPQFRFKLRLPAYWKDAYEVEKQEGQGGTLAQVHFIHTPNQAGGGVLFSVLVLSQESWEVEGQQLLELGGSHITQLGEREGCVFLFITPSDVQFSLDDEEKKTDYMSMSDDLGAIKSSFAVH
ncbi:hypothetical protein J2T17_004609 [Paenibacillus mucilaginosus]|uniref:S-layer homology domain-containing protein n=1 Tax=Paenibacillus mucilaginosus TaxID=61624 RepID=UPI003D1ECA67